MINLDTLKKMSNGLTYLKAIFAFCFLFIAAGIAWANVQAAIEDASESAKSAIEKAELAEQSVETLEDQLGQIDRTITVIKDDQEELEEKVDAVSRESMRHTILLERIATKMRVSTETE